MVWNYAINTKRYISKTNLSPKEYNQNMKK